MSVPQPDPDHASPNAVHRLTVPSPVGALTLFESTGAITALVWAARGRLRNAAPTPLLAAARDQLCAYFDRRLRRFDLPLAPEGTAFRRRVWAALEEIPFGATESYGSLAARIGSAPRAVGGACGANPIPILIPCHRVLGKGGGGGGRLHGYSGMGGLATKAQLLALEGVTVSR